MSAQPNGDLCCDCDLCGNQTAEWYIPELDKAACADCKLKYDGQQQPTAPKARSTAKLKGASAYHLDGCRGFTQITHEAFDTLADLPHADFRVYVAIVADCNWRTGRCDSSREQLSRRANVGSASIPRAVKRLAERGLVTVEYKAGFNGHNRYTVQPPSKFGAASDKPERTVEEPW